MPPSRMSPPISMSPPTRRHSFDFFLEAVCKSRSCSSAYRFLLERPDLEGMGKIRIACRPQAEGSGVVKGSGRTVHKEALSHNPSENCNSRKLSGMRPPTLGCSLILTVLNRDYSTPYVKYC